MWPRVAELMLGGWLILSPLIFRGTESIADFAVRDVAVGTAIVVFSLLSFWRPTAWAHLLTAFAAAGLGAAAYLGSPRPGPPGAQNEITLALMIVLLAILPNEATQPPKGWRVPAPSPRHRPGS